MPGSSAKSARPTRSIAMVPFCSASQPPNTSRTASVVAPSARVKWFGRVSSGP